MEKFSKLLCQVIDMATNKNVDELSFGVDSIMRILYPHASEVFKDNVYQFTLFAQGFFKTYGLIKLDAKEYENLNSNNGGASNE